jgi:hypothetical protein
MNQPPIEILPEDAVLGIVTSMSAEDALELWEEHAKRVLELEEQFVPECTRAIAAIETLNTILDTDPNAIVDMCAPTFGGGIAQ